jgi:hypothetical protein
MVLMMPLWPFLMKHFLCLLFPYPFVTTRCHCNAIALLGSGPPGPERGDTIVKTLANESDLLDLLHRANLHRAKW